MQVQIGNHIYDANTEPIMLILSNNEKEQICNMHPDAERYCQYPDSFSKDEIFEWINCGEGIIVE